MYVRGEMPPGLRRRVTGSGSASFQIFGSEKKKSDTDYSVYIYIYIYIYVSLHDVCYSDHIKDKLFLFYHLIIYVCTMEKIGDFKQP